MAHADHINEPVEGVVRPPSEATDTALIDGFIMVVRVDQTAFVAATLSKFSRNAVRASVAR